MAALINITRLAFGAYNWNREVRFWKNKTEEIQLNWVKRDGNKPADILAKQRTPQDVSFFFNHLIPNVISQ